MCWRCEHARGSRVVGAPSVSPSGTRCRGCRTPRPRRASRSRGTRGPRAARSGSPRGGRERPIFDRTRTRPASPPCPTPGRSSGPARGPGRSTTPPRPGRGPTCMGSMARTPGSWAGAAGTWATSPSAAEDLHDPLPVHGEVQCPSHLDMIEGWRPGVEHDEPDDGGGIGMHLRSEPTNRSSSLPVANHRPRCPPLRRAPPRPAPRPPPRTTTRSGPRTRRAVPPATRPGNEGCEPA